MLNWQIWIYDRVLLRMKKFWQTKNWMRPAQQWGLIQFIFISLNFLPRHFHKGFSKGGLFSEYTIIAQNLWFLFSQALNLTLLICHWKVIKWKLILFLMMKYLLKWSHYSLNTHFEWEKLTFDDFLVTTWEREVESQRKKKPQIPRLWCLSDPYFEFVHLPNE